mmetsp:Transcript_12753/g.44054  ORF Transcript_12753/g.44054 Transcript_12753/m.44054 type:complete len:268 (+) Transcript_12753:555-1358(+)
MAAAAAGSRPQRARPSARSAGDALSAAAMRPASSQSAPRASRILATRQRRATPTLVSKLLDKSKSKASSSFPRSASAMAMAPQSPTPQSPTSTRRRFKRAAGKARYFRASATAPASQSLRLPRRWRLLSFGACFFKSEHSALTPSTDISRLSSAKSSSSGSAGPSRRRPALTAARSASSPNESDSMVSDLNAAISPPKHFSSTGAAPSAQRPARLTQRCSVRAPQSRARAAPPSAPSMASHTRIRTRPPAAEAAASRPRSSATSTSQ